MCHAVPIPVAACELAPPQIAEPPVAETAGVIGHEVCTPMLIDAGSEDKNITPTLELAMPVAGTAGQLAALGVPLGTRPNMVASYVAPPRVIVTTLSFGQLFARNTAKHGGAMLGKNDGVATV